MAEQHNAAKAAAAFRQMDHDLGAHGSSEAGAWSSPMPPVVPVAPAEFNAMDHAGQHEQTGSGAPANPQPEPSGQGSNGQ